MGRIKGRNADGRKLEGASSLVAWERDPGPLQAVMTRARMPGGRVRSILSAFRTLPIQQFQQTAQDSSPSRDRLTLEGLARPRRPCVGGASDCALPAGRAALASADLAPADLVSVERMIATWAGSAESPAPPTQGRRGRFPAILRRSAESCAPPTQGRWGRFPLPKSDHPSRVGQR